MDWAIPVQCAHQWQSALEDHLRALLVRCVTIPAISALSRVIAQLIVSDGRCGLIMTPAQSATATNTAVTFNVKVNRRGRDNGTGFGLALFSPFLRPCNDFLRDHDRETCFTFFDGLTIELIGTSPRRLELRARPRKVRSHSSQTFTQFYLTPPDMDLCRAILASARKYKKRANILLALYTPKYKRLLRV